jgi:23S rRNA (cytosine1962-C5)-methyltransferase
VSATVHLLPAKDKPVRQRHPWVFSGAIGSVSGTPTAGGLVDVVDAGGKWLGQGYFNDRSQIVVRLLSWQQGEDLLAPGWWRERLVKAAALRTELVAAPHTDSYRLIYAESDGLPGLIVDKYGDWLSVQFLTLGIEVRRELIVDLLVELFAPRGIVDRSDVAVRRQEGLALRSGVIYGDPPPASLLLHENGLVFPADPLGGQKTGFYLDQRPNRQIIREHAAGRQVLNAFSFTGSFAVYALAGGAGHVTNVDVSVEALEGAEAALRANGFDPDTQADAIAGDVFQVLRSMRDEGRTYDLIILDPPKFATRKSDVLDAARGYKDINLLAFSLLSPGGLLATFSCSGLVSPDLFQKIVFGAALDSGRGAQIVGHFSQGPDHPISLTFPESEYLKGLLCRA